jgi:hypothetical protein
VAAIVGDAADAEAAGEGVSFGADLSQATHMVSEINAASVASAVDRHNKRWRVWEPWTAAFALITTSLRARSTNLFILFRIRSRW